MQTRALAEPVHLIESSAQLLDRLRTEVPLVQCLTNRVVTNVSANTLLALGAAPAMVDIAGEAAVFARVASAVLINLGSPLTEQRQAMQEAVTAATAAGTPWVLDPAAIGLLPIRTPLAHELAARGPAAIRGNASEILVLAGTGTGGRGAESTAEPDDAAAGACALARSTGAVVAVSGAVDLITDGATTVRVSNGTALLTRVTGGGCGLGAVVAAFVALTPEDALTAVVAATLVYTVAAERAASDVSGPGSFAVRFLDELAAVQPEDVRASARIRVESSVPATAEVGAVRGEACERAAVLA